MTRFAVVTYGCQMNQHDSSRVREVLVAAGYEEAPAPNDARVIVLNTCSVRDKAEQKLRSEVGRLVRRKRAEPDLVIAVAGCVAQQEGDRLVRSVPDIDIVLGPDNIAELPRLLSEVERGAPPQVHTEFDLERPRFLRAEGSAGPTAFVTTMKGCDERCSFCIVPTTRGPERYRPSAEIVDEIARLAGLGVREVTLLGQTVNSYQDPSGSAGSDEETQFPALLRRIAREVPRLRRLRYTSPHPRHLTPSLIRAHAELPVLPRHVHLPVQSGSDRILKRMIRRYTSSEYIERVQTLREAVPSVTLSTDIIVGFPGETRADFEETLSLVQTVGFVGVYGFKYSPRPFTPALKLGDDVLEPEKAKRLAALFALTEGLRQRHLETLVGSHQTVLVEGTTRPDAYTGRTERNEIVHFGCADDATGEILDVEIERAFKNSLQARLADPRRARPLAPKPRVPEAPRVLPVL